MKYILYATNKDGDGLTERMGEYDELSEIAIRVSHFAKDVVISIEIEEP